MHLYLNLKSAVAIKSTVEAWDVQFISGKCLALYSLNVLPLRLSPLTEDTSVMTVSSCGVKLQEVLSGLEKKKLKHWTYTCTFVAFLNITFITLLFFFPLGV